MKVYMTTEAMLRDEANQLAQRAVTYIAQKQLDKAIGCLDKAIKKIKRAEMLKLSPLDQAIYGPISADLSNKIAESIIKEMIAKLKQNNS